MADRLEGRDWSRREEEPAAQGPHQDDPIDRLTAHVQQQVLQEFSNQLTPADLERLLRLEDARQVEAKAARIKEWVTNKLRELEAQNQHLREQNHRCNQQLELLRRHMADLGTRHQLSSASSTQELVEVECVEERVEAGVGHRRNLSAGSAGCHLSSDLQAAVDSLALLPLQVSRDSDSLEEQGHDYAEIYTPSVETAGWDVHKPPTPPLHRFPSWESRIYQVASEGLAPRTTPDSSNNNTASRTQHIYRDVSAPVYATVKGRASQIRSVPFTGDSSDDSSEAEDQPHLMPTTATSRLTTTASDNTDVSLGSGISGDYAVPPEVTGPEPAAEWSPRLTSRAPPVPQPPPDQPQDKSGYLSKLGGKLRTWSRRWFHLDNAKLTYWKSHNDVNRKPQGEINIDENCRITRADGAATFEIATDKKIYYLAGDSTVVTEDWVKVLQNVQRRNATKLLLSKEHNKPTIQGWLTKVRNGHAKKCWCVLLGKMFLYFKSPADTTALGQINMRDSRVEEVDHVSDSDSEERDSDPHLTIGIFPNQQPPTYLLMPNKQDKDSWMYHLTVVSGGGANAGTQYEQLVHKLMEVDGDPNCVLWRHPLLLHSKETITSPLTTLSSEAFQQEAIKLFKSCQLFTSVAVDSTAIDYHVVLAQNALQQCLDQWELQAEMMCALVKQTSRHTITKTGMQAWQLLALAVSLFVPKNNKLLWYLKLHLQRNLDTKSECGKYAAYCERAVERTLQKGGREVKPSRMEVLSILLKNPYHHSLPHSIPVHLLNNTYQVVGFDGSSTVEEFMTTLNQEIGCRETAESGFTLFSDDPIEKDIEHYIDPQVKLCDVISKWETALREKGSGKFETTRVIQLTFKNRLYWRQGVKGETERERILLCYQTNLQVVQGRFPVTRELALELAALMAQIDFGEYGDRGRGREVHLLQALDRFYPYRYRDGLPQDALREVEAGLQEKWISLKGRSLADCVRIYLTCARKWPYFGAALFQAKVKGCEWGMVWVAVDEEGVSLLELGTMQPLAFHPYTSVLTFGGCQDDFILVVNSDQGLGSHKLLFALSRPKILDLTLLIADYMNAASLSGKGIGARTSVVGGVGGVGRGQAQPDLLKATPDHQLHRGEWGPGRPPSP